MWHSTGMKLAGAVAAVPAAVFGYMWWYGTKTWSPKERLAQELPGDDLLRTEDPFVRLQEEIEIDAPREVVWQVLAQMGQRKGGFYALSWLERLFSFHIHNTYSRVDEWQKVESGDFLFYHQSGIGSQIVDVKPGEYFTSVSDTRNPPTHQGGMAMKPPFGVSEFAWTWNFVLEDSGAGRTRFIARTDTTWQPWGKFIPKALIFVVLGSPSVFMVRKMLNKVKQISEGRQKTSIVDRVVRKLGVWNPAAVPQPLGISHSNEASGKHA